MPFSVTFLLMSYQAAAAEWFSVDVVLRTLHCSALWIPLVGYDRWELVTIAFDLLNSKRHHELRDMSKLCTKFEFSMIIHSWIRPDALADHTGPLACPQTHTKIPHKLVFVLFIFTPCALTVSDSKWQLVRWDDSLIYRDNDTSHCHDVFSKLEHTLTSLSSTMPEERLEALILLHNRRISTESRRSPSLRVSRRLQFSFPL